MGHHSLPPEIDSAVRSFIRRHKRMIKLGLLALIPLVLLLIAGVVWTVVRGAGYAATYVAGGSMPAIPIQLEQTIGEAAFAQLKAQTRFVTDSNILAPLNRMAYPLTAGATDASRKFSLSVSDAREVNAFALPGGYIVFNRGLLERAKSAEEIQGVLAHEMAHVIKRHSLLQMAKNMGVGLAVDSLSGGESGYQDALVRDASKLLSRKFSRDDERAADDAGWELLQNAQINPQGMVDFFVALQADASATPGGTAPAFPLLSTHPAPQERIDRLQLKKAALAGREFASFDADFHTLQAALRAPPQVEAE